MNTNAKPLGEVTDERRIERGPHTDPVTVRSITVPDGYILEVLDTEGDRRFWLPSAVTILGRKEVEHLIRSLADQQDEHTRRCIDIGKRRKEHELRQAIGAAPMEVF